MHHPANCPPPPPFYLTTAYPLHPPTTSPTHQIRTPPEYTHTWPIFDVYASGELNKKDGGMSRNPATNTGVEIWSAVRLTDGWPSILHP